MVWSLAILYFGFGTLLGLICHGATKLTTQQFIIMIGLWPVVLVMAVYLQWKGKMDEEPTEGRD